MTQHTPDSLCPSCGSQMTEDEYMASNCTQCYEDNEDSFAQLETSEARALEAQRREALNREYLSKFKSRQGV